MQHAWVGLMHKVACLSQQYQFKGKCIRGRIECGISMLPSYMGLQHNKQ